MQHLVPTFSCEAGCYIEGLTADREEYHDDYLCPRCGEKAVIDGERPATFVSAALYTVTRRYGGPEEGGWYYDVFERHDETVRCYVAGDAPLLAEYVATLRRRYIDVSASSYTVLTFEECLPAALLPETRPYYS